MSSSRRQQSQTAYGLQLEDNFLNGGDEVGVRSGRGEVMTIRKKPLGIPDVRVITQTSESCKCASRESTQVRDP